MNTIITKRIFSLLFYLLIIMKVFAQESGSIKGKIIEQGTKQPVQGATIVIKNTQITVISDSLGMFMIPNVPAGTYSIDISSIGFQLKTINDINVFKDKSFYLETELLEDAIKLGEVVVRVFK